MIIRLPRFLLLGAAMLLALDASAAAPDPADDPLPEGAKTRFGVTRPILRTGPAVAILAPGYTNFLAPTTTGGVRRYDLGTGRPFEKVGVNGAGPVGPGRVVASADGKRAVVARAGQLAVVDAGTGRQILAVFPPGGAVLDGIPNACLSADGKVLAYGAKGQDDKGVVVVWDVDKNEQVARVETELVAPVAPALSRDGKTLVTHGPTPAAVKIVLPAPGDPPAPPAPKVADAPRSAQVWEVKTSKELFKAEVTGMGGMVVASAFSPDGDRLAVSAADGPVDVWDVKAGKRSHTLLGRKGQGVRVAFSPDGKKVASIGPDYRTQMWADDGKPLGVTEAPPGTLVTQLSGFEFADNDRAVAWVTASQFCVAWEAPTGRLLSPLMDHTAGLRTIAFPEGGKDLFTSGMDGRVFRWDLPTGQLNEMVTLRPARLPGQLPVRPIVSLSADATRAAWLRTPAEVFDVATGADLFTVPPPSAPPAAVSYTLSPDGLRMIAVSRPAEGRRTGSCAVWDLTTQRRVAEFEVPVSPTAPALAPPVGAMSPDNTRLVLLTSKNTGGREAMLVVGYDLKTGKKLAEVDCDAPAGTAYPTAASDKSAVLTFTNGRVLVVDLVAGRVGEEIDRLPARGEAAMYCPPAFSPDGKLLAVGVMGDQPEAYGVRLYDWPRGKAVHTFMGHTAPVMVLQFSPDGKSLASGAQDTSVILWDLSKIDAEKK